MNRAWTGAALVGATLLGACGDRPPSAEDRARDAFVEALCAREGNADLWRLMSRGDVVFEEGWSRPLLVDLAPPHPWRQVSTTIASSRGTAVRWLGPLAHLRLRGATDMRLRIWGAVDVTAAFTRPRLTLAVAGHELQSRLVADDGRFALDVLVPQAWLDGWGDAYLTLSSVSQPLGDPARLQVARVEGVTWEPAP